MQVYPWKAYLLWIFRQNQVSASKSWVSSPRVSFGTEFAFRLRHTYTRILSAPTLTNTLKRQQSWTHCCGPLQVPRLGHWGLATTRFHIQELNTFLWRGLELRGSISLISQRPLTEQVGYSSECLPRARHCAQGFSMNHLIEFAPQLQEHRAKTASILNWSEIARPRPESSGQRPDGMQRLKRRLIPSSTLSWWHQALLLD